MTRSREMTALLRCLRQMGACPDGIALVRRYSTPARWWAASQRGDHMLWLAGQAGVRRQDLVLAACACARLALRYLPAREERPRIAIKTAERWARGRATLDEVSDAAAATAAAYAAASDAAYAAAASDAAAAAAYAAASDAAAYAAASDAAYAAAYAAASDAADAASDAADAASDAADAADAAYAAHDVALARCAALVRKRIPWSAVRAALAEKGEL